MFNIGPVLVFLSGVFSGFLVFYLLHKKTDFETLRIILGDSSTVAIIALGIVAIAAIVLC